MSLISLPLHLVCNIIESLEPYDFESLALVSHGTYRLLAPLLDRHNTYRREWHNVIFGRSLPSICSPKKGPSIQSSEPKKLRTIRQLLVHLAQDVDSASYVEHLDLSGCEYPLSDNYIADVTSETNSHDDRSMRDLIVDLAATSPTLQHLDRQDLHSYLDMQLDQEREDSRYHKPTILLLSILPNLRTVTMHEECGMVQIQLSADRSQHTAHVPGKPNTLELTGGYSGDFYTQFGIDMTVLLPFLVRPSLRNIHFAGGVLDWVDQKLWASYRPIGAYLEQLNLDYSCMSDGAFQLLLQDMQALRVLKLNYEEKDDFDMASVGVDCQEMMNVVAGATRETLETLSLTTSWNLMEYVTRPLRSLRRFHNLKELEVCTGIFYVRAEGQHLPEGNRNKDVDLEEDFEYACEFYDSEDEDDYYEDEMEDDQTEADSKSRRSDDGKVEDSPGSRADNDANDGTQDIVDEDMDSTDGGSQQDIDRFSLDHEACILAKTCPSIAQLLSAESLAQLEKLTIHVEAEKAELLCLKRLLRDLRGPGVSGTNDGNAAGLYPELRSLAVCLYTQNRFEKGEQPGAQRVIRLAQEYLKGIPGCKVRIVPYESRFNATKAALHASIAHGEIDGGSEGKHGL